MQGIKERKLKIVSWREKAKMRRIEINRLKKREAELKDSRCLWKSKYQEQKRSYKALNKRCIDLEKRMVHLGDSNSSIPARHGYSSLLICLAFWMRQQGNCSLRGCAKMISGLNIILGLNLGSPSHSSIANWEKKLGYHRLAQAPDYIQEWVVFLDESVSLGKQKLLLILGMSLDKYEFGKAPSFADTHVLYLGIKPSWKGEQIAQILKDLMKAGLRIGYCVSDQGNNLCKALRDSDLIHVLDCTHGLSKLVEQQYKKADDFIALSKACTDFKRRVVLSDLALYMSPVQRSKGRFLNLQPLSNWAYKMLKLVKQWGKDPSCSQLYEHTKWILDYQGLIEELYHCCETINQLFKIIKNKGLSEQTQEACQTILAASLAPEKFCQGIKKYLCQVREALPHRATILCNGDIIESYFGKFKNRLSDNPNVGLTDSCLTIANFNQTFDTHQIKEAMEKVKIVELKEWKAENVPINRAQLRQKIFKNVG